MGSESMNASLVHAFISISIVSAVLFALMIFSALVFRKVQRCAIWYSFCASWLAFSASFSLLSFAGQQFNSSQDRDLCLAQAGLVYAAPFLVGCTSTALVAQLLSTILDTISPNTTGVNKRSLFVRILAIVTPWSIWLAVLIGVLLSSSTHRDGVILSPNSTYCVVSSSPVPRLTAVFTTILCIIILSLEVVIAALLFRHRAVKDLFKQSVIMATRVFVFTGVVLTAAVTGLSFVLTERRGAAFDVMISVVPLGTAIIFGSQPDLWQGYLGWIPIQLRCSWHGRRRVSGPRTDVLQPQGTISIHQPTLVIGPHTSMQEGHIMEVEPSSS